MNQLEVSERAAALVQKAKAQVMMRTPDTAALIMKLHIAEDPKAKSMYTDGRVLGYNPRFVNKRTVEDLFFIFRHEVLHCMLGHPMRTRNKEDRRLWNVACDHAVNLLLKDAGYPVPKDGYCDEQYRGLAAESIYKALLGVKQQKQQEEEQKRKQEEEQRKQQQQQSQSEPGEGEDKSADEEGSGAMGASKDEDSDDSSEHEQQPSDEDKGEQQDSSQGKAKASNEEEEDEEEDEVGEGTDHGDVIAPGESDLDPNDGADEEDDASGSAEEENAQSGGGEGEEEEEQPQVDDEASDAALEREWQEAMTAAALSSGEEAAAALERAVRLASAPRQSYEDVLRQFLQQRVQQYDDWSRRNRRFSDVYLPIRGGIGAQKVLFAIDTSGSIDNAMLGKFMDAVQRIYGELNLSGAVVVYCDTRIQRVDEYDEQPDFGFEAKALGGGGTLFLPVFKYAQEMLDAGAELACLIYLTDQENFDGTMIKQFEHIPTLWVNPGVAKIAPFGAVCSMLE